MGHLPLDALHRAARKMGQQPIFRETEGGRQKKPILALPSDNTKSIFLDELKLPST